MSLGGKGNEASLLLAALLCRRAKSHGRLSQPAGDTCVFLHAFASPRRSQAAILIFFFPFCHRGAFILQSRTGWAASSGNRGGCDGARGLGFHSTRSLPDRGGTAGVGGKSRPELRCCSHPQRNLPRQTRTRSDASAMQNSCQVNQGEQRGPRLPCCGEPAELIAASPPPSRTPTERAMDGEAPGKGRARSSKPPGSL